MTEQWVRSMETVIEFIETHLDSKLDLEQIAAATHYSKYHLHRIFATTVGMTIHDYAVRRQLTEAARLLVFSAKPVIEIGLLCGYESQQAFTVAFKAMYKMPPAQYRARQQFYPLQLPVVLHHNANTAALARATVLPAEQADVPAWMELVGLVIDGYPCLQEQEYLQQLHSCIERRQALVLKTETMLIGTLAFSTKKGSVEFMGLHPQYRNQGVEQILLDTLREDYLPGREISITTYRERDRADTDYRSALLDLGFTERELLMEFGYPTQRFVLSPEKQEEPIYES